MRPAKVQVAGVEIGVFAQASNIRYHNTLALQRHKSRLSKLLQASIGMHDRQPHRIAEFRLGERKFERAIVSQTDGFHPLVQFAEQVRDTMWRGALAEVDKPFAQGRFIDQRAHPKRPGERGSPLSQFKYGRGRQVCEPTGAERADAMVHFLK